MERNKFYQFLPHLTRESIIGSVEDYDHTPPLSNAIINIMMSHIQKESRWQCVSEEHFSCCGVYIYTIQEEFGDSILRVLVDWMKEWEPQKSKCRCLITAYQGCTCGAFRDEMLQSGREWNPIMKLWMRP